MDEKISKFLGDELTLARVFLQGMGVVAGNDLTDGLKCFDYPCSDSRGLRVVLVAAPVPRACLWVGC